MIFDSLINLLNKQLLALEISSLTQVETLLLQGIWDNITYSKIGQQESYSTGYLTKVAAPKLYKKLSKLLGKEVSKKNCRLLLKSYISNLDRYIIDRDISIAYPSGAVSLDSPFYIERSFVESNVYQELVRPGALIRIQASEEMGKTSLLLRILDYADRQSYRIVNLNLAQIDCNIFSNLERFLRFLCLSATQQLNLESKLDEYWDEDIGSKISASLYFRHYLLEKIEVPIVLAFDELNRIFEYPQVARDFLPLLRSWYEEGKRTPRWQKLRIIALHSTEVYIPLKLDQSPFNIGLPIQLKGFDLEQVQKLAEIYQLSWQESQAEELRNLVGGHPGLIQIALYHLSRQEITFPELLKTAATPEGIYQHHLYRHWLTLRKEPRLAQFLTTLLKSNLPLQLEPMVAYKLRSMGLIKQIGDEAIISCELYRLYFTKNLIARDSSQKL